MMPAISNGNIGRRRRDIFFIARDYKLFTCAASSIFHDKFLRHRNTMLMQNIQQRYSSRRIMAKPDDYERQGHAYFSHYKWHEMILRHTA